MTKTSTTPAEPVEDVRTLAELEEAIRDGDTTVTAEHLRVARDRAVLDGLHATAAERRAAADAAAAREAAVDQLAADITALGEQPFDELDQRVRDAVTAYVAQVADHNARVGALIRRAESLGLDEKALSAGARAGWMWGASSSRVQAGNVRHHTLSPEKVLGLAESAIAGHRAAAARAAKAARPAPDVPHRRFRTPNGVVWERPADRELPEALARQLARGEVVEITAAEVA
ncbi:hypothetical protein [Pseudonocardia sp.]|uniref:hypothetical protein n=1 Tax=Pseudonocardia sp. TaxID=60912 RepID=UPI002628822C|nr:hypothetical protein [Pseudonocardia sp.]